jgi:PAS domain S-box-containing protein
MNTPIRLLLVEDTATDAELMLRELKRASLDVTARRVETEPQFRELLLSSPVDIILADYSLPNFDGAAALEIAREIVPEVPFIFVSGSIGEERAIEALHNGATDYILKDRLSRLGPAVTRALHERRQAEIRRAAQHALHLSHQRFEYAAKATGDALWDWDIIDDVFWLADRRAGRSGDDLMDEKHNLAWWLAGVHPSDRDRIAASLREAIAGSVKRWDAEYSFRFFNDEYLLVSSRANVIYDDRGVASRVVGAIQDVTDTRRAEEAIRESELRFRSVAESAADGILLTTPDATIIYANPQAVSTFGRRTEELVQENVSALLAPYARDEYFAALQDFEKRRDANASLSMLTIGLRADGSEFPVEMSISTWTRDGKLFFTQMMRDVSERVAAERRQHTQFAVTRLLTEARSPIEALPELMRVMSEGLEWEGAAIWLFEARTQRLQCAGVWVRDEHHRAAVEAACRESSFAEGEGLPGIAFANCTVETGRFSESPSSPYHAAAAAAGIATATAIPVRVGDVCLGIIEFFERDAREPGTAARLAVTTDIARQLAQYLERDHSERERLAGEERLREAQRLAHVGSWEYDRVTGAIVWSEEVYSILGVDPATAELSFESYTNAVSPHDRDRVRGIIASQLQQGQPETIHFQHHIEIATGERVVECHSRVVLDDDGRVLHALGSIQDITELADSARTIKRLSRLNAMILDFAAEGVLGVDRDGSVNFTNPAASVILGWSEDAMRQIGNSHSAIHHTKTDGTPYPLDECPMWRTLHDGEKRSVTGEYFWRPDGQPYFVDYECAPIVEEDEIIGAVMTFRDVTDSQRLEKQLELAKRIGSLGRVAATMAHEFNNILMGIEPFAEIIRRRGKTDEKLVKSANQISSSVRRGRRVTDEILRFSRPAAPVLKIIDLGEWLRQLEPELDGLAGAHVRVSFSIPEAPVDAACDVAQLQQVVTNLVVNARDAMESGGEISIVLAVPAGQRVVQILVRDTGTGIPFDAMDSIFEPLFTTKRVGTGLGLAVARQVVTQHGGTIEAENLPARGAQFRITLPFGSPSPSKVTEPPVPPKAAARRVLLVEDDELVTAGLCTLLEGEGLICRVLSRGGGAVEAVAEFRPDWVILDLTLPDMDGADVFRTLRARWPDLPVIFSTGHGCESELAWALGSERVELLQKPYDFDTLLAAVDRVAVA